MSDSKSIDKDLGPAGKITMDEFLRDMVATMFEMDNDVATLVVTLDNPANDGLAPTVDVELRLKSISQVEVKGS